MSVTFTELFALYFQSPALAILSIRRLLLRNDLSASLYQEAQLMGSVQQPNAWPPPAQSPVMYGGSPNDFNPNRAQAPSEQVLLARLISAFAMQPQSTICGPNLTARAEEILLSNVMLPEYLWLAIYEGPLVLIDLRTMLERGFAPVPGIIVKATAACALPIARAEALLGGSPVDQARQHFSQLASQAAALGVSINAIPIWLSALEAAEKTPEPQDDVQAMTQLTSLLTKLPPSEAHAVALKRMQQSCVLMMGTAAVQESMLETAATAIGLSMNLPPAYRDVETMYTAATEGMFLAGQIAGKNAIFLGTLTARSLARAGHAERANEVLLRTEALAETEGDKLDVAQARLDPSFGDQGFEPVQALALRLDQSIHLPGKMRISPLQSLITYWPLKREGVEKYMEEVLVFARQSNDAERVRLLMTLAMKCYERGAHERVRPLIEGLKAEPFAAAAATIPPGLRPMVEEVMIASREWTEARSTDGAIAKSSLQQLAAQQRYKDAAQSMQLESDRWRALSFYHLADADLAGTAKAWYLAGNSREALKLFEQCIAWFEARASDITHAATALGWFASWSRRYAYAAFAALDCDQAIRALAFAEAARFRTANERLGPRSRPPAGVSAIEWIAYCNAWRAAAGRASNDILSEHAVMDGAAQTHLNILRQSLLARGVAPAELLPTGRPVDVEALLERVRKKSKTTVVLYSIRANDHLRFICMSEKGVRQIPLEPLEGARIVGACEAYALALREAASADRAAVVRERLPQLLEAVGAQMFAIVEEALAGTTPNARVLWIPHGVLSVIPLAACERAQKSVYELASVLVAPSLTSASDVLDVDRVIDRRVRSLRGRADEADTATEGGSALARLIDPMCTEDLSAQDASSFVASMQGHSVLHLECHGVFVASNPGQSYLKLAKDTPVRELLDGAPFAEPTLVVLGSSDSATVSQLDANDAVGLPMTLRCLGATAVVGAQWGVNKDAAMALSASFYLQIAKSIPTPEALRIAALWVRGATMREVIERLASVGHPAAERLRGGTSEEALELRPFADPVHWGGFCHWGAPTVLSAV